MYWKRPKKSVLPYLLVFFFDTELLFDSEFWLKPKYHFDSLNVQISVRYIPASAYLRQKLISVILIDRCIGFVYHL